MVFSDDIPFKIPSIPVPVHRWLECPILLNLLLSFREFPYLLIDTERMLRFFIFFKASPSIIAKLSVMRE